MEDRRRGKSEGAVKVAMGQRRGGEGGNGTAKGRWRLQRDSEGAVEVAEGQQRGDVGGRGTAKGQWRWQRDSEGAM